MEIQKSEKSIHPMRMFNNMNNQAVQNFAPTEARKLKYFPLAFFWVGLISSAGKKLSIISKKMINNWEQIYLQKNDKLFVFSATVNLNRTKLSRKCELSLHLQVIAFYCK